MPCSNRGRSETTGASPTPDRAGAVAALRGGGRGREEVAARRGALPRLGQGTFQSPIALFAEAVDTGKVLTFTAEDLTHAKRFSDIVISQYPASIEKITIMQTLMFMRKHYVLNPDRKKLKDYM